MILTGFSSWLSWCVWRWGIRILYTGLFHPGMYVCMYVCMYVWALVIAPLQDFYSEALPTTARTLNRSFTPKRMSNCEWRTCPGSLRGGLRWIRTRNPPAARHRTYPYTTAPHIILCDMYSWLIKIALNLLAVMNCHSKYHLYQLWDIGCHPVIGN